MSKIGNLISFPKIYIIKGTNTEKNVLYLTVRGRLNLLDYSSFGGGLIIALFHCHFVMRKQLVILIAHHDQDRKFNEFFKNV